MHTHARYLWALVFVLLLPLWALLLGSGPGCAESDSDKYKPLNTTGHPINYVVPVREKSKRPKPAPDKSK